MKKKLSVQIIHSFNSILETSEWTGQSQYTFIAKQNNALRV